MIEPVAPAFARFGGQPKTPEIYFESEAAPCAPELLGDPPRATIAPVKFGGDMFVWGNQ